MNSLHFSLRISAEGEGKVPLCIGQNCLYCTKQLSEVNLSLPNKRTVRASSHTASYLAQKIKWPVFEEALCSGLYQNYICLRYDISKKYCTKN